MRRQMVSNMVLFQFALTKGLQSYIQVDRFAPCRCAAPGVLPVFDVDIKDTESLSDQDNRALNGTVIEDEDDDLEDGEIDEGDSSFYRVLSGSRWILISWRWEGVRHCVTMFQIAYQGVCNFDSIEGALIIKFHYKGLLIEALTHAGKGVLSSFFENTVT